MKLKVGDKYRQASEIVSAFMCVPCSLCVTIALKEIPRYFTNVSRVT